MELPELLPPILSISAFVGSVHPFGQILWVALTVFVAGLLEVVFSSITVLAEARV